MNQKNPQPITQFKRYYTCPKCNYKWDSDFETVTNDDCPECNISVEPYYNKKIKSNPSAKKK